MNSNEVRAIIDKATETDPFERYATVGELQEDIRNYSSGIPVRAYRTNSAYRLRKFLSRNKVGSLLGGAALIGLSAAFAVTVYQYQRAETALASANQRFTETRELTSFMLNDMTEQIQKLPGSLGVQKSLRENTNKYLNILAEAAETDESLRLEYAIAERKVGELSTQAGGQNFGNIDEALEHIGKSIDILNDLSSRPTANEDTFFELAEAEFGYGYTLGYHLGKNRQALPYLKSALVNFNKAIGLNDQQEDVWLNRARTRWNIFYASEDTWETSTKKLFEMRQEYELIRDKFPQSKNFAPHMATFLRSSANYKFDHWSETDLYSVPNSDRESFEKALVDIKESKKIALMLAEGDPNNTEHIYQYIWSQEIETLLFGLNRDWEVSFLAAVTQLAEQRQTQGDATVRQLIETDPQYQWRRDAVDYLLPAIDLSDKYIEQLEPFDGAAYFHNEAIFYNLQARAIVEAQLNFDFDESEKNLIEALEVAEKFRTLFPSQTAEFLQVPNVNLQLAELLSYRQVFEVADYSEKICMRLANASSQLSAHVGEFGESDASISVRDYRDQIASLSSC